MNYNLILLSELSKDLDMDEMTFCVNGKRKTYVINYHTMLCDILFVKYGKGQVCCQEGLKSKGITSLLVMKMFFMLGVYCLKDCDIAQM